MLRQIVIPTANRLTVDLPDEYLNHSVEILVFKLDEAAPVSAGESEQTDPLAIFDRYAGSFDGTFSRDELYDRCAGSQTPVWEPGLASSCLSKVSGSWSFQDRIPKPELGNERKNPCCTTC